MGSQVRAGAHGAGQGDEPGDAVGGHEAAGRPVAQDEVEDAVWQDTAGDAGEDEGGLGGGLGGLEDDGVAGGQRGAHFPHEHHEGVVPGDDLADDTDGLAAHLGGQALGVLAGGQARADAGSAGEEAQLGGAGEDLLAADEGGELTGVALLSGDYLIGGLLDGVGQTQEKLLALRRGGQAPGGESPPGGRVGGVDVLLDGDGAQGDGLTGAGVLDLEGGGGAGGDELPVDVVGQGRQAHGESLRSCACGLCWGRHEARAAGLLLTAADGSRPGAAEPLMLRNTAEI